MGFCIWLQDRLSGSIELALAMLCRSRQDYMDAERAKGRNFDDIYSEVSQSGLLPVTFSGVAIAVLWFVLAVCPYFVCDVAMPVFIVASSSLRSFLSVVFWGP